MEVSDIDLNTFLGTSESFALHICLSGLSKFSGTGVQEISLAYQL